MFNHNVHSKAAALLSAGLLFTAMPLAASAAETRTVAVPSGDLNLAKDAGRAVLQQRIAHAVKAVCGPGYARTTADIQAYATCSKQARAGATSQFDAMIANVQTGKRVAVDRNIAAPAE